MSLRPAILLSLAFLALAFTGVACSTLPGRSEYRGADTRHRYALAGDEGPVVVFENGLGNSMRVWTPVFEPVSGFARAFAYDRAGVGGSRSETTTRDGATIVRELRALLQSLELEPPYVLVGHSLGGQFVELYARTHPEEVAAVVFVDARHAEFGTRCLEAQAERCAVPWHARLLMPSGPRGELDAAEATTRAIRDAGPFPPVPVRVLTGRGQPPEMPNLRRAWAESQADLVRLSPLGTQEICEDCGHYVQRDAPERVIGAIRALVE